MGASPPEGSGVRRLCLSVAIPAVWRPPPSPGPQGPVEAPASAWSVVSPGSWTHRLLRAGLERTQLVGALRSGVGRVGGAARSIVCRGNGEFDKFLFALFLASKSMQEGWGSGGDDMSLGPSQWDDEEGGMWNSAASQESSSSCSSWGNAPKKGLQKVCAPQRGSNSRLTHSHSSSVTAAEEGGPEPRQVLRPFRGLS